MIRSMVIWRISSGVPTALQCPAPELLLACRSLLFCTVPGVFLAGPIGTVRLHSHKSPSYVHTSCPATCTRYTALNTAVCTTPNSMQVAQNIGALIPEHTASYFRLQQDSVCFFCFSQNRSLHILQFSDFLSLSLSLSLSLWSAGISNSPLYLLS